MPKVKPPLKKMPHRFFQDKQDKHHLDQTVNVTVIVNEKSDDAVTDCFKSLFSCAGKAAK